MYVNLKTSINFETADWFSKISRILTFYELEYSVTIDVEDNCIKARLGYLNPTSLLFTIEKKDNKWHCSNNKRDNVIIFSDEKELQKYMEHEIRKWDLTMV